MNMFTVLRIKAGLPMEKCLFCPTLAGNENNGHSLLLPSAPVTILFRLWICIGVMSCLFADLFTAPGVR